MFFSENERSLDRRCVVRVEHNPISVERELAILDAERRIQVRDLLDTNGYVHCLGTGTNRSEAKQRDNAQGVWDRGTRHPRTPLRACAYVNRKRPHGDRAGPNPDSDLTDTDAQH